MPVKMTTVVRGSPFSQQGLDVLLSRDNVAMEINSYDLCALEEARQLKEEFKDVTITAVTVGPEYTAKALRVAYGMGADRLVRIESPPFRGGDEMELAGVLAGAAARLGFDLILCGLRSDDIGTGMAGIGMARLLGIPAVTRSLYIEAAPGPGALRVHCDAGRGDCQVVDCPLPAVVTVERSRSRPRYPGLARYLRAPDRIVTHERDPGETYGTQATLNLVDMSRARPRPRKTFTPDDSLPASEKMKLIMSGGVARGKAKKQEGGRPGAEQLFDYLVEKGFIKKEK